MSNCYCHRARGGGSPQPLAVSGRCSREEAELLVREFEQWHDADGVFRGARDRAPHVGLLPTEA